MQKVQTKEGTQVNLLQDSDIETGKGYIKFPDGTMIQWGTQEINTNLSNNGDLTQRISFPQSFIDETYSVFLSFQSGTSAYQLDLTFIRAGKSACQTFSHTEHGSSPEYYIGRIIHYLAIGRWK